MGFLLDSCLLGLEYSLLALGVYISFRILNLPDLTTDGSFVFGMAVSAFFASIGHPFAGLILGFMAGALSGAITGFLHIVCKINAVLAGILTMSGLYTINITVLGGPNLSLIDSPRFYDFLGNKAISVILLVVIVSAFLSYFFNTLAGLSIRATGSNIAMVRASSIHSGRVTVFTLALSNALVGLSGGILAQCQGFGDVSAGSGIIVIGLASVIIGEVICGKRGITFSLISAIAGSVIYRVIIALALRFNLFSPNALKLLSAVIVGITLSIPTIKAHFRAGKNKKENALC